MRNDSEPAPYGEILPAIPAHLEYLFEDRPLLPGEFAADYDKLLLSIIQQTAPADVIEEHWSRNMADLIWNSRRCRRFLNRIIAHARHEVTVECVVSVLEDEMNGFDLEDSCETKAEKLVNGWLKGDSRSTTQLEQKLSQKGFTLADMMAQAFLSKLADIERVERMIASADQRRDALLREIERRRSRFSHHLRDVAVEAIDAEPLSPGRLTAAPAPSAR